VNFVIAAVVYDSVESALANVLHLDRPIGGVDVGAMQ
jgi:hypothetical protein